MMRRDLLSEPEVWAMMCHRFPWIAQERGESGEGLIHLEFAALRHGVERAADSNDVGAAVGILTFIEELVHGRDTLHPEVIDALDVSFLEDLYLAAPAQREFAAALLLPSSKERWNRIAAAHEARSG